MMDWSRKLRLPRILAALAVMVLGLGMPAAAEAQPLVGLHGAHVWPPSRVHSQKWNAKLLGVRERFVYDTVDGQALTLYVFHPRGIALHPRPVVIYIHGGALRFGTAVISNRNTPHNRLLVSVERQLITRGMDFVSINYRLAPLYPWPDPLIDVKHAVRFIETHAKRLYINQQQMAVMGDSAGGELSSFVGLTMRQSPHGGPLVRGVVDMFGPVNRRTFALRWRKHHGLAPNPVYGVYTWKRVRRESAVSYVTPQAPPFLIIQGTRDHIVPPAQSRLLKAKLRHAGVPVQEILVHHAGHELVAKKGPIHPGISFLAGHIVTFLAERLKSPSTAD